MKTRIKFTKFLTILLLPLLWVNASGAMKIEGGGTGKISGYVRNAASREPLVYAAVTVFSVTDSSMVAGTITNNDGSFVISMLTSGNYFLEVSDSGFEKKQIAGFNIQPDHPRIDIGEVQLNPNVEIGKEYNCKKLKTNKH